MPIVYKQPSVVSGLTIQDIMRLDSNSIDNLSNRDLAKVTSRLVSAVNKRISRTSMADRKISEPIKQLKKTGLLNDKGKLSVRGKSRKEVQKVMNAAAGFLSKKSSTAKGLKEFKKRLKIGDKSAKSDDQTRADIWYMVMEDYNFDENVLYRHYLEVNDLVQDVVESTTYEDASPSELYEMMRDRLEDILSDEYEDEEIDFNTLE